MKFLKLVKIKFRKPFKLYLPLTIKYNNLLFPIRNEKIFIDINPNRTIAEWLYGEMIAIFESYIYI